MKKMTTIRIDKEVYQKAKELGLNISKICENALKLYIQRLQDINNEILSNQTEKTDGASGGIRTRDFRLSGAGFEPGTTALPRQNPTLDSVDWSDFERYLMNAYSNAKTRNDRLRYARKFADCLLENNYSRLLELSDDKRTHVMKALSCLAKYLGVYEDFKKAVRDYGLKWSSKSSDDLLIERLTRVADPNEVFEWIKEVKRANPDLEDFMDFIAITGLRLKEATISWNLIINLAKQQRLREYYNEENLCLEHFRFKELFIRRTKKAFVSFIPKDLIERIKSAKHVSPTLLIKRVKSQGFKSRFSDIREAHATFMTKYLRPSEIDFLHGRVSSSIFMRNYFNPALIADLKQRVFKGISEIKTLTS